MLPGVMKPIQPMMTITLPPHLRQEALRLRQSALPLTILSQPRAMQLVLSAVIGLERMEVLRKTDHPNGIERVGEPLHAADLLPLSLLATPKREGKGPLRLPRESTTSLSTSPAVSTPMVTGFS